ncbi:hypothetical protein DKX38_018682 [Salix brachista]|uniref:Reverse transcriptase Ty1/copia-type domain-containing protein n=1 Tax=Salix brachista TaxID=2182728 RepID=A0A5N5KNM9_9ROSI|nr:hypothetical protein DKX38_018682 [Salix brachista]
MLLIYVDDILITESSLLKIKSFILHLSTAFHMKDPADLHFILGLQITRDESTITVTQTCYLLSLLQNFGLDSAKLVSTYMASGINIGLNFVKAPLIAFRDFCDAD